MCACVQNDTVTLCVCYIRMWKATAGQSVKIAPTDEVDDWETDPDFEVPDSTSVVQLTSFFLSTNKPFFIRLE